MHFKRFWFIYDVYYEYKIHHKALFFQSLYPWLVTLWQWLIGDTKPCFTSTSVVTSHENNACSVFASQAYLHTTCVHVRPRSAISWMQWMQVWRKCCFHVMSLQSASETRFFSIVFFSLLVIFCCFIICKLLIWANFLICIILYHNTYTFVNKCTVCTK